MWPLHQPVQSPMADLTFGHVFLSPHFIYLHVIIAGNGVSTKFKLFSLLKALRNCLSSRPLMTSLVQLQGRDYKHFQVLWAGPSILHGNFPISLSMEIAVIMLVSPKLEGPISSKRNKSDEKQFSLYDTKNFSKLLYQKQVACILSTRNALSCLMNQPILGTYQLYHTPPFTFKIPYETNSLLFCLRFPE